MKSSKNIKILENFKKHLQKKSNSSIKVKKVKPEEPEELKIQRKFLENINSQLRVKAYQNDAMRKLKKDTEELIKALEVEYGLLGKDKPQST